MPPRECREMKTAVLTAVLAALALSIEPVAASESFRIDLAYADAKPVIEVLRRISPGQLAGVPDDANRWTQWVARRDAEIRARVARGDEDSILNFLLFGTSFTTRPRALNDSAKLGGQERAAELVRERIDDLSRAIIRPGSNERLQFTRSVIARAGIDLSSSDAAALTARYLRSIMARVVSEVQDYRYAVESTRALDPVEAFVERSKLLQTRGLSSDTSILPSYAVEEALKALRARNLLAVGSVARAAVVGPGLDFTDKTEGYDFYPPQTVQPFALVDTLRRLKLAATNGLEVTTLDLNTRINEHLEHARDLSTAGQRYRLELVHDADAHWLPPLADYWHNLGDQIGDDVRPSTPPIAAGRVDVRAVQVRSDVARSVVPRDLDIVLQHLRPSPQFDLIVATNIFVYYASFEQALALVNAAQMLRPGGILLSNNALPERLVPAMKSIGSTPAIYSDRQDDRDLIVWYQRQ